MVNFYVNVTSYKGQICDDTITCISEFHAFVKKCMIVWVVLSAVTFLCAIATTLVLMDLMDSNALLLVIVFTSAGILMYSALVQSSYGL